MRRWFKTKAIQAPSPRKLFLFVREGDKDHFWPVGHGQNSDAGQLLGVSFESTTPVDDAALDVISFSSLDDVEIRAQPRESTALLTKRLMAETGLQLIGWRQVLGQESQGQDSRGDLSAQLRQSFQRI